MSIFVIGDVQGCYDDLRRLLDKAGFDPARDRLWLAGDLVNRGPGSLETLRFVRDLGKRAVSVLGNHDLHLLAIAAGNRRHDSNDPGLERVLRAKDRDELLHWLRHRPLMHYSGKRGYALIHAGLPPQWDMETALACAREVERVLQGEQHPGFFRHMYGNEPRRWSGKLHGTERWRFIVNCFTRLRYCDRKGNLGLNEKGPPGSQRKPFLPWFQVPGRASRHDRILFGHWSTLGYYHAHNVWALDSGCVWGGRLTAVKLRRRSPPKRIQVRCPGARRP